MRDEAAVPLNSVNDLCRPKGDVGFGVRLAAVQDKLPLGGSLSDGKKGYAIATTLRYIAPNLNVAYKYGGILFLPDCLRRLGSNSLMLDIEAK